MVSAMGIVYGLWEIDEIAETQTLHLPNGKPRKIDFTVALTRADDERIDEVGLITDLQDLS
jgi:phage protein U